MSQKKRQILACILAFIFAFYYANSNFFYHSVTKNGITFIHSHLHNNAHKQAGTHNDNELNLISLLSQIQSSQAVLCFFGIGLFILFSTLYKIEYKKNPVSVITGNSLLRAPPALF
jgi:hypothetical protein